MGENTEPCGTPEFMENVSDIAPSMATLIDLSDRKLEIHFSKFPSNQNMDKYSCAKRYQRFS